MRKKAANGSYAGQGISCTNDAEKRRNNRWDSTQSWSGESLMRWQYFVLFNLTHFYIASSYENMHHVDNEWHPQSEQSNESVYCRNSNDQLCVSYLLFFLQSFSLMHFVPTELLTICLSKYVPKWMPSIIWPDLSPNWTTSYRWQRFIVSHAQSFMFYR